MHGDGNLRLKLLQDFARGIRRHGEGAADGNHRDIDFAECLDLLGGQFVAQIAQVSDTNRPQIKYKGRTFERSAELLLVDRNRSK